MSWTTNPKVCENSIDAGGIATITTDARAPGSRRYVTYFMRKIEMFKFYGIKPYVVFDGGYLPSKAATEQDRLGYVFSCLEMTSVIDLDRP